MTTADAIPALDRLLDPVARCLPPDALRQLAELSADAALQQRLETLAERNTEGLLTTAERDEYESYVSAIHVIGLLQAKARTLLAAPPTA